jgi:hypothetical protein
MQPQTIIFKYLIKELALKKAVTYTFTGFLALASHGKVSGRFRVGKNKEEHFIEINITGNQKPPLNLKADPIDLRNPANVDFLKLIQSHLDDASSLLDEVL